MNYCLLTMLAKPLLVKLLGYLKVYVFDRKFWLLYWKSQFFLSTGGRHFLTKPENSNSTIHRAVGFSCPRPPFSASAPCPGPVEGEGSTTWGKNGEKTATSQVSGLLQTRGRDLQVQITAEKRERIAAVGHHLWCSTSEEGQEVSLPKQSQAKSFQEAERRQYFYGCWWKDCSLDAAATSAGVEVLDGAPAGKELA